jgi:phosphoglycerate dehydrogenase-like enzyme
MPQKILLSSIFEVPLFASTGRTEGLQKLSQLVDFVDEPAEVTSDHAEGVVASIAGGAKFTESFYTHAKQMRLIARWGVGYDQVNVDLATEHGVIVTVAPVHMKTVAEYTIGQWFAAMKRTFTLNRMAHGGDFGQVKTYEIEGSALGLFGCGRIGQEVARRARPLLGDQGRLLIYDLRPDIGDIAARYGAEVVNDPRELFEQCDVVSLHVSGDDTVVNYDLLTAMQPHASVINPSRGDLVNDKDMKRALDEDKLFYYIVDDPPNGRRALHTGHPRVICTNHNGGNTVQSVARLDQTTIQQVTDVIHGRQPEHILNTDVLDHPRVKEFLLVK